MDVKQQEKLPNYLKAQFCKDWKSESLQFNIMVLGECSSGKSTFINSLFGAPIFDLKAKATAHNKEVALETTNCMIEENKDSVLNLSVTKLNGFGSRVNNADQIVIPKKYIEEQMNKYLEEEFKRMLGHKSSQTTQDSRVHLLVYLVQPRPTGLSQLDIETLKTLNNLNKVIIMSKIDSMTRSELEIAKKSMQAQMKSEGIVSDSSFANGDKPLSIFCGFDDSQTIKTGIDSGDRRVYDWGEVSDKTSSVSDMKFFRKKFFEVAVDLVDSTHCQFYRNFRNEKLTSLFNSSAKYLGGGSGVAHGLTSKNMSNFQGSTSVYSLVQDSVVSQQQVKSNETGEAEALKQMRHSNKRKLDELDIDLKSKLNDLKDREAALALKLEEVSAKGKKGTVKKKDKKKTAKSLP